MKLDLHSAGFMQNQRTENQPNTCEWTQTDSLICFFVGFIIGDSPCVRAALPAASAFSRWITVNTRLWVFITGGLLPVLTWGRTSAPLRLHAPRCVPHCLLNWWMNWFAGHYSLIVCVWTKAMGSELQRDEFIHHSSIKPSNQDKEWMPSGESRRWPGYKHSRPADPQEVWSKLLEKSLPGNTFYWQTAAFNMRHRV